jgi:hypothetical protein
MKPRDHEAPEATTARCRTDARLHAWSLSALGALLVVASSACGGAVFSSGSPGDGDSGPHDAATVDSPASDGGQTDAPADGNAPDGPGPDATPPWSPDCPASAPVAGSACTQENLQCEYGDAWWSVSCDVVMECDNGQWGTTKPSYEPCTPEPGPNPAQCPATYADVPEGPCKQAGLTCQYPDGQCSCQVPVGPIEIDGGTADWTCLPGDGCPPQRPRLGTACTMEGASCTYVACSYGEACMGGVWQGEEEGCAGAAGGQ